MKSEKNKGDAARGIPFGVIRKKSLSKTNDTSLFL